VAGPANKSLITLGNIGVYTGVLGAIFQNTQPALQVWVKWVNTHGGLNGHPVRVISADSGGDPTTSLTLAKNMVEKDHVLGFIANWLIFEFPAFLQYVTQQGIPLIGGDATNEAWFSGGNAFPQGGDFNAETKAGTKWLVQHGASKVGTLYCVEVAFLCSAASQDVTNNAASVGAKVVYTGSMSLTAPSFTSNCINAKAAGVQGLWIFADSATASRIARDCAAQGFHPKIAVVALSFLGSAASDPNLDGTVIPSEEFPATVDNTPATMAFHQAFAQYDPSLTLDGISAGAWVAGQLAVAGSKYLGDNPTGAQFIKGLRSIKNDTLGGLTVPLNFTSGHASGYGCSFIVQISNRKLIAPQGLTTDC
jgi:branched-chain amino acid transport system substrate-binding protein